MKESSIFGSIDESAIESLLLNMDIETLSKGESILDSQIFVQNTFFIMSGRVKVSVTHPDSGREQILFLLSKGDLFDIVAFLDETPAIGVVSSLDEVQLLKISNCKLKEIIFESRALSHNIYSYLGKQLRVIENLTIDLSLYDVSARLIKQILKHANHDNNQETLKLIHDFTHSEIAKLIGSSRVVVNRILQTLKKQGHIRFHRGHIEINDVHELLKKHENHLRRD